VPTLQQLNQGQPSVPFHFADGNTWRKGVPFAPIRQPFQSCAKIIFVVAPGKFPDFKRKAIQSSHFLQSRSAAFSSHGGKDKLPDL
jgi:hypothetical protein